MAGDVMSILRARIQEANVAIDRGNLPYAETLLDETILQAKESGLSEIRATAIHDRAHLAIRRGRPEEAVVLGYEALQGRSQSDGSRSRAERFGRDLLACSVSTAPRAMPIWWSRPLRRSSTCAGRP